MGQDKSGQNEEDIHPGDAQFEIWQGAKSVMVIHVTNVEKCDPHCEQEAKSCQ